MTDQQTSYGQYANGQHTPALDQLDRPPLADLAALDPDQLDQRGARIPFGDRWNQTLLPTVASGILRLLVERNPAMFGDLLSETMTGHRKATTGRKRTRPPA